MLLGFTKNVHKYFSQLTLEERKRVLKIISDEITYKDGALNIELKPVFQFLVENQYIVLKHTIIKEQK